MSTITELAQEAYECFETATRTDGTEYTRTKDDAPAWVVQLNYAAHGDFLPDDWRYEAIRSALGSIADDGENVDLDDLEHEWADGYVDVYTAARFTWLASHIQRQFYVDEAVSDYGWDDADGGVAAAIGAGQYAEAREVFSSVRASLEAQAE